MPDIARRDNQILNLTQENVAMSRHISELNVAIGRHCTCLFVEGRLTNECSFHARRRGGDPTDRI